MHILTPGDYILCGIYFLLILFFANRYKTKLSIAKNPLAPFFLTGLVFKLLGAIASGLIYQYYYKGGDTMYFYASASSLYDIFFNDFFSFFKFLLPNPLESYPYLANYPSCFLYLNDPKSWTVIRIAGILNLFAFDSYLVTALFFSLFSFFASWKFLSLMIILYPNLKKQLFYCVFLIPSVLFWGSGIFKDTLTLSGLLLFVYYSYFVFIKGENIWLNGFKAFLSIYLVSEIRFFFVVIIIPCIFLWFFANYRDKIRNRLLRQISFPLLLTISITIITVGLGKFVANSKDFSKDALKEKTEGIQQWHASLGGSAYTLGDVDLSDNNAILKLFPAGVNVTFFRPYIWETHTLFQMISAFQSLFFLIYTIYTIYKAKIVNLLAYIGSESFVIFGLVFSIFYAFMAGFTSYNFGALDRYKIPALPFYMIALVIINYRSELRMLGNSAKKRRR
jgi:hypothetical protein